MNPVETKKALIEQHEEDFAWSLAAGVFEKPQLSVWMILIPIILVFHMYRHQQYVDGRRTFTENYLVTRRRILAEALAALQNDADFDIDQVVSTAGVPDEARREYREWVQLLFAYYTDLLVADGTDFEELVHSAYRNRTNYLLILHQLSMAETRFNEALKPQLSENAEAVTETMAKIQGYTENLRRDSAYSIFS